MSEMNEFRYSISTTDPISARVLLTIAQMIEYDGADDDYVIDAFFFVLDVFNRHVEHDGWIGQSRGVEIWEGAATTVRALADSIEEKVAEYKKARQNG